MEGKVKKEKNRRFQFLFRRIINGRKTNIIINVSGKNPKIALKKAEEKNRKQGLSFQEKGQRDLGAIKYRELPEGLSVGKINLRKKLKPSGWKNISVI